jgi:hypothetical protein
MSKEKELEPAREMIEKELETAREMINAEKPIVVEVGKHLLDEEAFGDIGVLIQVARVDKTVAKLLGRITILFPDLEKDEREIFEIPESQDWMVALHAQLPYLPLLLNPESTFKLLMMCEIGWSKGDDGSVLPVEKEAVAFMLDAGMTAFVFGKRYGLDEAEFTRKFMSSIGAEELVDDKLLAGYGEVYAKSATSAPAES